MRPEDILGLYSYNSLRTIARLREYPLGSLRRPDLIVALAERLFAPDEVPRMLDALAPGEEAALRAVQSGGGRLARASLVDALLDQGLIDPPQPARPRETVDRIPPTTRRFDELCARLTARGLLFSEPKPEGTLAGPHDLAPGLVVFVPSPVLEAMRQRFAASPSVSAESRTDAQADVAEGSSQLIRGRLIVQPSYSLLVLPPLDEATLLRLGGLAETVSVAEVAEFRLTQAALFHAVERGETVASVIAFLEERSEAPLPQNVRYSLDAWSRAFEQVRVFHGAAIVEGAPELLDVVQADPHVALLVVRRLSRERVLLRDAVAAEHALSALGELPLVIRYDSGRRSDRISVSAEGVITLSATHDLLLPIALRRLAEPRADGHYQVVQDRVRAAVESAPDGLTGILKWLRTHADDIPAELLTRLRVWALPPDAVRLEQPLLLHMPRELLAELRALPELAPLLADEYRPPAALVQVLPEQREALLAALAARGIILAPPSD